MFAISIIHKSDPPLHSIGYFLLQNISVTCLLIWKSLGKYHIFDYPFKCVWHETGGYIQYGDIWIQTDTLDQFILPPHIFTLKGKALLLFGDKFLKNDKFLPEIKNKDAEYCFNFSGSSTK